MSFRLTELLVSARFEIVGPSGELRAFIAMFFVWLSRFLSDVFEVWLIPTTQLAPDPCPYSLRWLLALRTDALLFIFCVRH